MNGYGFSAKKKEQDGRTGVLIGDSRYLAPPWTEHDIRQPGDHGEGLLDIIAASKKGVFLREQVRPSS